MSEKMTFEQRAKVVDLLSRLCSLIDKHEDTAKDIRAYEGMIDLRTADLAELQEKKSNLPDLNKMYKDALSIADKKKEEYDRKNSPMRRFTDTPGCLAHIFGVLGLFITVAAVSVALAGDFDVNAFTIILALTGVAMLAIPIVWWILYLVYPTKGTMKKYEKSPKRLEYFEQVEAEAREVAEKNVANARTLQEECDKEIASLKERIEGLLAELEEVKAREAAALSNVVSFMDSMHIPKTYRDKKSIYTLKELFEDQIVSDFESAYGKLREEAKQRELIGEIVDKAKRQAQREAYSSITFVSSPTSIDTSGLSASDKAALDAIETAHLLDTIRSSPGSL